MSGIRRHCLETERRLVAVLPELTTKVLVLFDKAFPVLSILREIIGRYLMVTFRSLLAHHNVTISYG